MNAIRSSGARRARQNSTRSRSCLRVTYFFGDFMPPRLPAARGLAAPFLNRCARSCGGTVPLRGLAMMASSSREQVGDRETGSDRKEREQQVEAHATQPPFECEPSSEM